MKRVCAYLGAAVLGLLSTAIPGHALDREPAAYAEQVLAFAQRHCIGPMLADGAADPTGLKRIRKHLENREIHIDPTEANPDAALTLSILTVPGLAPFCSVHQTPGFWVGDIGEDAVWELAAAARERLAVEIANGFDAGLLPQAKRCIGDALPPRMMDWPVSGGWVSEDGSRSVVVWRQEYSPAEPGLVAVPLGSLADCGGS